MEEAKKGRGGKRLGAGRPRTGSKLYAFRASQRLAEVLDSKENKGEFIKECIELAMSAHEPKLTKLGDVYPATRVEEQPVAFFDMNLVAGFPVPLDNDEKSQDIGLLQLLCPHPEASYLIRVNGNSMIDAGIYSGDIVIVDKSNRNPSELEVAVCELNGEYTLKRFVRKGNTGWLVPANPDFPQIQITEDDDFSIWGTVTYIIHKPRG